MQTWELNSEGGYFAAPKLSKDIRHLAQPMMKFRQFVKTEPGYAKRNGDRMLVDIVSDADDTTGHNPISETQTVPKMKYSVSQVEVIAREFGRKVPFTGKLEAFSEVSVQDN